MGLKKYFSQEEQTEAMHILANYRDERVCNNSEDGVRWGIIDGKLYDNHKIGISLKRSSINNVKIEKCEFVGCACAGSNYKSITFQDDIFDGNNFIFSYYLDCRFTNETPCFSFKNNDLSQCQFFNCIFINTNFQTSTISQSTFVNCKFINCLFDQVTFEDTKFDSCLFENVDMRETNIEFTFFKNSTYSNIYFPFYQFPYIIGAKDILSSNNSDVFFVAGKRVVEATEYLELIKHLISYFLGFNELYPVANLLIIQDENKLAIDSILCGIDTALKADDFRMVKHFCRLGKFNSIISPEISKKILSSFDNALIRLKDHKSNDAKYFKLLDAAIIHAGEVRQLLLTSVDSKQVMEFSINTNISSSDTKKINKLQNKLQRILDKYGDGAEAKFIEIRHDSPYELFIQIVGNAEIILSVSYLMILAVRYFGAKIKSWFKKRKDKKSIANEITQKYGTQIDIKNGYDKIELLKAKINGEIKDLLLSIKSNNSRTVNKHINSFSQKLIGLVDETFEDNTLVIFNTNAI